MLSLSDIAGRISDCKPLLVKKSDGNNDVLIAAGCNIQSFASKTGELISTFHKKHTSNITCLGSQTNKTSSQTTVTSCACDGSIELWEYFDTSTDKVSSSNQSILSINVNASIYDIIPISTKEAYLVLGPLIVDSKSDYKLVQYSLSENKILRKICEMGYPYQNITRMVLPITQQTSNTNENSNNVMTSKDKGYQSIVFAGSKSKLIIWSELQQTILTRIQCPYVSGAVTCLSSCRNTEILVTGHSHGEILIWHNPSLLLTSVSSNSTTTPICTKLHWHSHSVKTITMSPDGAYIYSGGSEGVLVVWQTRTGNQTFLPRLGSTLSNLVYEDEGLIVTTLDNVVRIVNTASMKIKWQLKQLYIPPIYFSHSRIYTSESFLRQADSKFQCKLVFDPRSGLLATNGYPGELQMTDVRGMVTNQHSSISNNTSSPIQSYRAVYKHSYPITDYTRVSGKETNVRLYVPSVSLFKFYKFVPSNTTKTTTTATTTINTHNTNTTTTTSNTTANTTTNTTRSIQRGIEYILCSVDVRRGEGAEPETSLKFWLWEL